MKNTDQVKAGQQHHGTATLLSQNPLIEGEEFESGIQGCDSYWPEREYGYANEHECFAFGSGCEGRVSYCLNCFRDHHSGGWNTCTGRKHKGCGTCKEYK